MLYNLQDTSKAVLRNSVLLKKEWLNISELDVQLKSLIKEYKRN